jgi:hypothetical protein
MRVPPGSDVHAGRPSEGALTIGSQRRPAPASPQRQGARDRLHSRGARPWL